VCHDPVTVTTARLAPFSIVSNDFHSFAAHEVGSSVRDFCRWMSGGNGLAPPLADARIARPPPRRLQSIPTSCAASNAGTPAGAIPAKVSEKERAIVTATLPKMASPRPKLGNGFGEPLRPAPCEPRSTTAYGIPAGPQRGNADLESFGKERPGRTYFQNCHQGGLFFVRRAPERSRSPRSGVGRHSFASCCASAICWGVILEM
jgi:hypothetical protein